VTFAKAGTIRFNHPAWGDEVPGYPILLRPGQHGVRGELGSVVGDDTAWSAAPPYQAGQLARYTVTSTAIPVSDRTLSERLPGLSRSTE
jgi:hypothetical protein